MEDIVTGVLAVLIGALICFQGWLMLRIAIPLWGALAGFLFGAGLVTAFTTGGFLSTMLGWVVGLLFGLVFGLLAYLYYELSVILAMAGLGFAIATAVLVAMGVTWSWVIILVGVLLATMLAIVAIVGDLPMVILVFLSATGGASTIVGGAMLLFGVVDLADFTSGATTQRLQDDWWWYAIYAGLVVAGIVVQMRGIGRVSGTVRDSWREAGGREMRGRPTPAESQV